MKKIPVVEAEGSNYEIGFQIGEGCRKQIRDLLKIEKKEYKRELGKLFSFFTKKVGKFIKISEKYFPKYVEEIKGMAEGSGIPFDSIFALGCEDELVYNCTSVAGFSEGEALLGHNEDWLKNRINSLYIAKIRQMGKPDSLGLSYVGMLPGFCVGLNSKGFAFTGNTIHAKKCKIGVPWQFFSRAFLDAENYRAIIKIASSKNKSTGFNSMIASKNKIFDLEMTPTGYALLKGKKYLAHTNHVISKKIKSQEKSHDRDSVWRLERANELLEKNNFNVELIKKILSDHKHYPDSVCCHEGSYATLASVIINLNKKTFLIAHGNPCKNKYKEYRLD